jgi:transcriptional regulator of acetoin/glycerol metabolism
MAIPQRAAASLYHQSSNFDGVALNELPFLDANLLLIGLSRASREQFEASLTKGPVNRWEPGKPLVLPSAGTLVLHEVGCLTHDDQVGLLAWLERTAGRTRVICTTSASLFAQVEAGRFIDTLYYRLNTVSLDVRG